jgi:hypothetical protein
MPDDREKAARGSPRDAIFLLRNQEETMKVIQLPSIQEFHKLETLASNVGMKSWNFFISR